MKKKILSVLLAITMLFAFAPVYVFAGTDDYPSKFKNAVKDSLVDDWNFYNRECTSFVAWRLNSRNGVAFTNWYGGVHWGNADNWGAAAKSLGITVDNTPAVGAVAWWSSMHVAWVEAVDGNNVTIEEYNNPAGSGNYKERTISASNPTGYIHIKDIGPNPTPSPKHDGLMLGDKGDDVKKLQETLNGMTGTSLNADGYFGTNTETAVKEYQKKKGLAADGWYGNKTKATLEDEVKKLQETLNGMTGTSLNADGHYGSNTKEAVKAYQKKKGLTADGWYGASTKAALEGDVKTLQTMLNAVTGTALGADGYYGSNTKKAVKEYQQKKGLTADGWYGDITKKTLEADYNDLTSTSSPDPTSAPISTPSEAVEIPEQPSIGESTPDTTSNNDGSSSVLTVYGGDTLQIAVDDKMADFGDAQPFLDTKGRTQVPIRAVSELLDCNVDWDPITRSATITRKNGDTIVIAIDSDEMIVNGNKVKMDTAAVIANDRTYIPVRFVAEALGLAVNWI